MKFFTPKPKKLIFKKKNLKVRKNKQNNLLKVVFYDVFSNFTPVKHREIHRLKHMTFFFSKCNYEMR